MIEIKHIQKSYGDFHALKDISLTFKNWRNDRHRRAIRFR